MTKFILISCQGIDEPLNDVLLLLGSREVPQSGGVGDIEFRKVVKEVFQHMFHSSMFQI